MMCEWKNCCQEAFMKIGRRDSATGESFHLCAEHTVAYIEIHREARQMAEAELSASANPNSQEKP